MRTDPPPSGCPSGAGRARPLPPDERRAMLVAATLPLVAEHGKRVTTRQISEAAGVAEGTIFRVFPDKEALVSAAIAQALDPSPTLAELAAVDPSAPLPQRLVAVTRILQRRLIMVFNLMMAVGMSGPKRDGPGRHQYTEILAKITGLLEPDSEQFRCPVEEVARLLRLLTFAGSHPMITDGRLLTAEEIAEVVLDGVRRRPDPPHHCDNAVERGDHAC